MLLLGKVSVCVSAPSTLKSSQTAESLFHSFLLNHLSFAASLASSLAPRVKFQEWMGMLVGVSPAHTGPGMSCCWHRGSSAFNPPAQSKAGFLLSHPQQDFVPQVRHGMSGSSGPAFPLRSSDIDVAKKGRKTIIKTSNPRDSPALSCCKWEQRFGLSIKKIPAPVSLAAASFPVSSKPSWERSGIQPRSILVCYFP